MLGLPKEQSGSAEVAAMNERENESGLQAQRTRPADARLQVGESLPLQPSLTITAAKQPSHLKSARLIWTLAVLGALIGFFATTFEASEKPFAEHIAPSRTTNPGQEGSNEPSDGPSSLPTSVGLSHRLDAVMGRIRSAACPAGKLPAVVNHRAQ